jgi:GH25 family lysozyme M1 (1,4-beta-N-acetylmuramidase)
MSARFCVVALVAALCGQSAHAVYQDGIDVSVHQGTINWTSVKNAGYKFAFTKATEGIDFVDSRFASNMSGAKAAGVLIGPYHYGRPDSYNTNPNDAANEANDFADAIAPYYQGTNLTLRPVLDLEELAGVADEKTFLSNWVNNFATTLHSRIGFYPLIYCNTNFATNYLNSTVSQYDLWLANWTNNKNNPPASSADGVFNGWKFWQYSSTGSVSGISGNVDLDVFNGTMPQLSAYIPDFHPGDFDNNNVVDGRDYLRWRKTMGQAVNRGTGADANFSGSIDSGDYTYLRANFGKTYTSGAGSGLGFAAVPEPSAWALLGLGLLGAFNQSARRRRRDRTEDPSRIIDG